MRHRLALLALSGATFGLGCTGDIGGKDKGEPPGPSSSEFACQDGLTPANLPLRRLSRVQLENTYRDLVVGLVPADAGAVMTAVAPQITGLAIDASTGPMGPYGAFTRLDQRVNQEHVDRPYALAEAIGRELTSSTARMDAAYGTCAADADAQNDDACLDAFIASFGERALRRAITPEDVAFYRQPAGNAPFNAADWADVTAALLMSPHTLNLVEHGADPAAGAPEVADLSAYELASRLSYHFWQTLPDDRLFELARSGELLNRATYEAEVDRIFADPRAQSSVRMFYAEWLSRRDVAQLNSRLGLPAFDAMRGEFTPSGELREAMFDELVDMATYYTFSTPGGIDDIYTSDKSFARSDELASLYGVPAWSGSGEPPAFADPERRGLLTRAAMTATGSANTRPIMKGVFVRRALLCDEIPEPDGNLVVEIPTSVTGTARQVVEGLTETGTCIGCHKSLNSLGYSTENFDPLGRLRTEERLIDPVTGAVAGTLPVDTVATPAIIGGDTRVAQDAIDVQNFMLDTGHVQACFARIYFRFTFGRIEELDQDGCELAGLHLDLTADAPLAEVMRKVALTPTFTKKNFGE